jgi:taurine--2-oxoglutarate transaminase
MIQTLCGEISRSKWKTVNKHYFVTWTKQLDAATLPVERAEGDEFILTDGRRVFDFLSTSFQASFGHSQPAIIEAIKRQMDRMSIASPKAIFGLKDRVTEKLLARLNLGGGKLFYTVGGAEAVENALKIARHWTGRPIVLARQRSYHGASLGAMSVSGDWRSDAHLTFSAGTVRIPEPHDDPNGERTRRIIESTGPEKIAAVILETITGANGVIIPPQSWWEAIQSLCREFEILLISDEVLCGFGRTGPDFGIHQFGVRPDLVCLSKAITGGYIPFGAVWTSERISERYDCEVFACGLTSYAHPLGLAALEAVLDLLAEPAFRRHKQLLETQFAEWLHSLRVHPQVDHVRHRGLLAAIELKSTAPTWSELIERGVYAFSKQNMLVLAPPLNADPTRLARAMSAVEKTFAIQRSIPKPTTVS